jgi:geranylgeranyl diphosphate synthase type I
MNLKSTSPTKNPKQISFQQILKDYKQEIDSDIEKYSTHVAGQTSGTYGEYPAMVAEVFTDILNRDSKRIRGVLTLIGYEMCGGTDRKMILQAARAVEMMHAYILIIDDLQDRSDFRRGGPSAHRLLEIQHKIQGWKGGVSHNGMSLALNATLLGSHGAQIVLANLDIPAGLKLKALSIMNHTMIVTAHGQTLDIAYEIVPNISNINIDDVLQWKTAHYSFLNPLHMGMVLAGAGCEDTNAITEYALNAGKAFQVTDDLLIATSHNIGKDPLVDIREGKQTLLTIFALKNAPEKDQEFLRSCMGNPDLSQADYKRCRQILIDCGAVQEAKKVAREYVDAACSALAQHSERWNNPSVSFLDELANYLLRRDR